MIRLDDWDERLAGVLERHAALPGAWGVSDCWIMAADAIEAMTGAPFMPKLRGYDSEKAGYRLFARHRFKTVLEAFQSVLEPVAPLQAMRGDIAIVSGPNGPSCGVVTMAGIAVKTIYESGAMIRHLPITDACAAFRV